MRASLARRRVSEGSDMSSAYWRGQPIERRQKRKPRRSGALTGRSDRIWEATNERLVSATVARHFRVCLITILKTFQWQCRKWHPCPCRRRKVVSPNAAHRPGRAAGLVASRMADVGFVTELA